MEYAAAARSAHLDDRTLQLLEERLVPRRHRDPSLLAEHVEMFGVGPDGMQERHGSREGIPSESSASKNVNASGAVSSESRSSE